MDYWILGPLEVVSEGTAAELGAPKQRAVLAILLLQAGEIVSADRLIELVWGSEPPRTAAHSIQIYVSELRKALEPLAGSTVISTRASGYVLECEPDQIDARRFERLVAEGSRAMEAGERASGADLLRGALALWRGAPLADFPYEEFAQPHVRRLSALRLDALEHLAAAELALGRELEVLTVIDSVIGEDPLRERARELQMLALYAAGRAPEALRSYQEFRRLLADELGLDPSPALRRLEERILLHDPSLETGLEESGAEGSAAGRARNPYKGLRSFEEEDADDFFGRESLTASLVSRIGAGARLVALVGPSGTGKSSVVSAGLVPALRADDLPGSGSWRIARMTPGRHPFEELDAALADAIRELATGTPAAGDDERGPFRAALGSLDADGRLVVVVDQFEELYASLDGRERERFEDALATALSDPDERIVVVLTLRADFYDRPLLHPRFGPLFAAGVVNVLPMTPAGLEAAITGPARRVAAAVESSLVAELVSDTATEPGALPLLQYALTDLFDRRSGTALTLEEYRSIGGLRGLLSRRSESVYARLDVDLQAVALQVFLRLVLVGHGTTVSRRRVPLGELTAMDVDPGALSEVLEAFGRQRLLSFDRDPVGGFATVEVAHEALLVEWDRLAEWIDRHRADLRRREAMTAAIDEWESSDRHPDYLFGGSRLEEFDAWSRDSTLRLTDGERAFLDAGRERMQVERSEERDRLGERRRLERRARTRLLALAVAVVLLAGASVFGVLSWLANRPPDAVLVAGPGGQPIVQLISQGFRRGVAEFEIRAEERFTAEEEFAREIAAATEDDAGLVVAATGDCQGVVEPAAVEHPDTAFVALDCSGSVPNVTYVQFAAEEGSFLAGAAAALTSRTGVIGFVGGVRVPPIGAFQAGFEAGARAVDPNVRVLSDYLTEVPDLSGFNSPTLGFQAAERMYVDGVDVIFPAAGASGQGVVEAALQLSGPLGRHLWSIGVDADVYRLLDPGDPWRPHILTSVVKRYDQAVFALLEEYARDELVTGNRELDMASGGVDLVFSGGFLDDIRPRLEELRAQIISGEIDVPTVPSPVPGDA